MASERQVAANRLNAQYSTGPRTEAGKRRSRRNAFRHGLTAESVVTVLENEAAYQKFEQLIIADYAPETAVERALVVRVASLLWRLRRSVAIESGLFQIQGQILRDRHSIDGHDDPNDPLKIFYDLLRHPHRATAFSDETSSQSGPSQNPSSTRNVDPVELAVCFLRLENFDSGKLELIGRYETRLWRQLAQTIYVLDSLGRFPASRHRARRPLGYAATNQMRPGLRPERPKGPSAR